MTNAEDWGSAVVISWNTSKHHKNTKKFIDSRIHQYGYTNNNIIKYIIWDYLYTQQITSTRFGTTYFTLLLVLCMRCSLIIFIRGLTVAREEASALSALSTLLLLHSSSIVSLSKYLPIYATKLKNKTSPHNHVLQLFHKRTPNEFKSIQYI